jgi:hypothetical protein
MFLIVHTVAAAVIAQRTGNPELVFLYSFLSHFVLDFIPHGDEKLVGTSGDKTKQFKRLFLAAATDGFLIIIFSIYYLLTFAPVHYGMYFLAMGGAMIPDLISGLSFMANGHFKKEYPRLAKFQKIHKTVHTFFERKLNFLIPLKYGIIWQAFVFLTFLTLLR